MNIYEQQIKKSIEIIRARMKKTVVGNIAMTYMECGYRNDNALPDEKMMLPYDEGVKIGGKDRHYWFHLKIDTPETDGQLCLMYSSSEEYQTADWFAQGTLFVNAELVQGLDINHREYPLEGGKSYDIYLYFYTGMRDNDWFSVSVRVDEYNIALKDLYYDLSVPFNAMKCLDETGEEYALIFKALAATVNTIEFSTDEAFLRSVDKAQNYIRKEFYEGVCKAQGTIVSCIGHTHIDVAWLWTYAQTVEKVQRSFSTVLSLMKQFPEYKFMSSQPQLYKYLKESEPELYAEIKCAVAEGRWETEGAMWLEADCNVTGGESLVRQLLHGKKFFKEEFGVESRILWLPDVFGYSAALPQILRKSGVDKFVTSKISWNEYNKIPYDTFMWRGIDGTEIFTYFLTAQEYEKDSESRNMVTYSGLLSPSQAKGTWNRYQQKVYNNETLMSIGYGDGGGGTTTDMLEQQRRLSYGIPGIPRTQISTVTETLERVKNNFEKSCEILRETPRWVGELYLELHRGTYTTAAKNKKYNRLCEMLLGNTEALAAFDKALCNAKYPKQELFDNWETVLLNQFHDVLPGSSIQEVYEDTEKMYADVIAKTEKMLSTKLVTLAENINTQKGLLVYNPTGFEADGIIDENGRQYYVSNIPAFGWKNITGDFDIKSNVTVTERMAENAFFVLTINDCGNIISLFDKRANREIIKEGQCANQLQLFEDRPYEYDAWDIIEWYKHKQYNVDSVSQIIPYKDEVSGGFIIKREYNKSVFEQKIMLYDKIDRIDFELNAEWHEEYLLLKTAFPFDINTDKATYEIQFGNIERPTHTNTSWEKAKFEVCGHKWADISEGGFGVSIINDCKYGFSADSSEIKLSLLKASRYPSEAVDMGYHEMRYSIYPHIGNYREAGVVKEALQFNNRLMVTQVENNTGKLPAEYSMLKCDSPNVVVETVKMAEYGDEIIVRMYEAHNCACEAEISFGFNAKRAYLCDLQENTMEEITVKNNALKVKCGGFEIVTLKIEI